MGILQGLTGRFPKINIRTYILILSLSLVFISLLILSYISYRATTSTITERIESIDESNLRQINNKISFSIGEIYKLTTSFSHNDSLINLLKDYNGMNNDAANIVKATADIRLMLYQLKLPYDDIYDIVIFSGDSFFETDFNNKVVSNQNMDIRGSDIYKTIKSSKDNLHIFEPFSKDNIFTDGFKGIAFGSIIYDGSEEVGTIFVVMKDQWLSRIFQNEKNVAITCRDNSSVLWASDNSVMSQDYDKIRSFVKLKEGNFQYKDYKGYYMSTKYNDWMVVTLIKKLDVSGPINKIRNYVLLAILFSIFISFPVVNIISTSITRPISELVRAVRKYRTQDNFDYNPGALKGISLKRTFIGYFVLIVIIPMLIYIVIFYFTSSSVIEDKVKESIKLALTQTADNIDSFIKLNERISAKIIINDYIQNLLISYKEGSVQDITVYRDNIGKIVEESLVLGENIFDASIYGVDKRILFSTSYYYGSEKMSDLLYKNIYGSHGDPLWLDYDVDRYNRNAVKLIRKIYSIQSGSQEMRTIGYMSMMFNESSIEELYRDLNLPASNVYLTDEAGMIISHGTKSLIGQMPEYKPNISVSSAGGRNIIKNGTKIMFLYVDCSKLPWILVSEVDYKDIKKDTSTILLVNIYTAVALLLIIIALSYLFSRILTGSLGRMKDKLAILTEDNINMNFAEGVHLNEIEELGRAFDDMTRRVNGLIKTVYLSQLKAKDLENEKKDAELIALQSQINPHFFYNTIDAIRWMIHGGRKEDAAEMLTSLADLFRLGISREHPLISIEEEIKYARAYADIQILRLGEKVKFWWSIDSRTFDFLVPKLILQPIIENAIKHGIHKKDSAGNINIFCYKDGMNIFFKVIDDGMGIENTELEKIQYALNGNLTGTSIGIFNVQKRIKLFFGEKFGISIESSHGSGTVVKIVIPQVTAMIE